MTKIISFCLQKGGVGKTTTTAATAKMLNDRGFKVLAVDMDSQGSLTTVLTGHSARAFGEDNIYKALEKGNIKPFIKVINDTLHYVPANNHLALYDKDTVRGDANKQLKNILEPVKKDYDYILIDLPPALGILSNNGLIASSGVVIPCQTERLSFEALPYLFETIKDIQKEDNPELKVLGILRSMSDTQRLDNVYYLDEIKKNYPEFTFNTVIKRRATIGRLADYGIVDNSEFREIEKQFNGFIEELL